MAIDKNNPVDRKEFAAMQTSTGIPAATTAVVGGVKKTTEVADFVGIDVAAIKVEMNAFLAQLRTAGIIT